jgi:hypothetical protein
MSFSAKPQGRGSVLDDPAILARLRHPSRGTFTCMTEFSSTRARFVARWKNLAGMSHGAVARARRSKPLQAPARALAGARD